ncbi:glycosyltransferase [Microbacterium sp. ASV49]|uniref:Glycosyltransferase n=1 Tax=Microbacterium candidum TaxID=3041922 RepID=A0ABT7N0V6_9MICO|nr:hypothetical protein [Microbacterium sp. ASV49]MDL9980296.1 hypothetical protein [Microbacterium sp. ASV49]
MVGVRSAMTRPHLTFVLIANPRRSFARPTVAALFDVAERLRSDGLTSEVLLVGGHPEAALEYAKRRWPTYTRANVRTLPEESLPKEDRLARALDGATGTHVCLIDDGDLISAKFARAALSMIDAAGSARIAVYPEYVVPTDDVTQIWRNESSDSGPITYLELLAGMPWQGPVMTTKPLLADHLDRGEVRGRTPADLIWFWAVHSSASGVSHVVAPATTCFRDSSINGSTYPSRAVIPGVDLASLMARTTVGGRRPDAHAPPSLGRVPSGSVIGGRSRRAMRRLVEAVSRRASQRLGLRDGIHHIVDRSTFKAAIRANPSALKGLNSLHVNDMRVARDDGYSQELVAAVTNLGEHTAAVVAVGWLDLHAEGRRALNYAKALDAFSGYSGRTAILAVDDPSMTVHDVIPGSIRYLDLDLHGKGWSAELRARFLAQLVMLVDCSLAIASAPVLADAAARFPELVSATRVIALEGALEPATAIPDGITVIADSQAGADTLKSRVIGAGVEILVHEQPSASRPIELARGTRAYTNEFFTRHNPFRVLIAAAQEEMQPLYRGWSTELVDTDTPLELVFMPLEARCAVPPGALNPAQNYLGIFPGGLAGVDTYGFHAVVTTDTDADMSRVIVDALSLGLPVVAWGAGSPKHTIVDGVTGLCADTTLEVIDALGRLAGDVSLRRRLVEAGHIMVAQNYSWEAFTQSVAQDLIAPRARH